MAAPTLKPYKVRLHLPSGEIIEADPEEVQTSPPFGTYIEDPHTHMQMPLPVSVVNVRAKDRPHVLRTFAGAFVLELQQEQSRIVIGAPPLPGLTSPS